MASSSGSTITSGTTSQSTGISPAGITLDSQTKFFLLVSINSTSQTSKANGGGGAELSSAAIGGIVGGILVVFLILCIVIIVILLKRRRGTQFIRNSDEQGVVNSKEQTSAAADKMASASEYDGAGNRDISYLGERDFGGRLQYPNDDVDISGRLHPHE